jgi:hypothetical protein
MNSMTLRSLILLFLVLLSGGAFVEGARREEQRGRRRTTALDRVLGGQFGPDCNETRWTDCGRVGLTKLCNQTPCDWDYWNDYSDDYYWYCPLETSKRPDDPGWRTCVSTISRVRGLEDCDTDFDEISCYWEQDCDAQPDGCNYSKSAKRRGWWCRTAGPVDGDDDHPWSEASGRVCPVKNSTSKTVK